MKQGKYAAPVRRRRRRNTLKPMLIAMAVVLLLGCVTGGTLAWLTSTTDPVTNTFTVGDINITLDETTSDYKMIPGYTIAKDPKVTVKANSEDCILFVKVTKSSNFDTYMTYSMADGWKELSNAETGSLVYYRTVSSAATDTEFGVLEDNKVTVKDTVTKELMSQAASSQPTLTFQAAAVQLHKSNSAVFTAAEAYQKVVWPTT